jgi:hypothetical protein
MKLRCSERKAIKLLKDNPWLRPIFWLFGGLMRAIVSPLMQSATNAKTRGEHREVVSRIYETSKRCVESEEARRLWWREQHSLNLHERRRHAAVVEERKKKDGRRLTASESNAVKMEFETEAVQLATDEQLSTLDDGPLLALHQSVVTTFEKHCKEFLGGPSPSDSEPVYNENLDCERDFADSKKTSSRQKLTRGRVLEAKRRIRRAGDVSLYKNSLPEHIRDAIPAKARLEIASMPTQRELDRQKRDRLEQITAELRRKAAAKEHKAQQLRKRKGGPVLRGGRTVKLKAGELLQWGEHKSDLNKWTVEQLKDQLRLRMLESVVRNNSAALVVELERQFPGYRKAKKLPLSGKKAQLIVRLRNIVAAEHAAGADGVQVQLEAEPAAESKEGMDLAEDTESEDEASDADGYSSDLLMDDEEDEVKAPLEEKEMSVEEIAAAFEQQEQRARQSAPPEGRRLQPARERRQPQKKGTVSWDMYR